MTHPLALALLRAEAAAHRATEGTTGAHPDDPPHPAMLVHRLRGEWQRAGCPVEVSDAPSDAYQRGHRDSLLDAAAQMDSMADVYDRAAKYMRTARGYDDRNRYHYAMHAREAGQAQVLRWARDLLRDLADRCPDDPLRPLDVEASG